MKNPWDLFVGVSIISSLILEEQRDTIVQKEESPLSFSRGKIEQLSNIFIFRS